MKLLEGVMAWRDPVFAHFRSDAERLAALLPSGLELDRFDGEAWVSVVALEAVGPAPRVAPTLGKLLRYRQVNLRTYVRGEEGPGIYLLDTWVDRRLPALGARLLGMPYHVRRPLEVRFEEDRVSVRGPGTVLAGRVAAEAPAPPVGVERFLLERYWAYGQLPGGHVYAVGITHEPWRVRAIAWTEVAVERFPLAVGPPRSGAIGQSLELAIVRARADADAAPELDRDYVPA
jgi:uncharacterized protein